MERVKFDLRYKEDIIAGRAKVETRDFQPVRIVCFDWCGDYPVMGKIEDDHSPILWAADGRFGADINDLDLFVLTDNVKPDELPKVEIGMIICSDVEIELDSTFEPIGWNKYYKCYTDNPTFMGVWNIKAIEDLFEIDKKCITKEYPKAFLVMNLYVLQRNADGEILSNRVLKF